MLRFKTSVYGWKPDALGQSEFVQTQGGYAREEFLQALFKEWSDCGVEWCNHWTQSTPFVGVLQERSKSTKSMYEVVPTGHPSFDFYHGVLLVKMQTILARLETVQSVSTKLRRQAEQMKRMHERFNAFVVQSFNQRLRDTAS